MSDHRGIIWDHNGSPSGEKDSFNKERKMEEENRCFSKGELYLHASKDYVPTNYVIWTGTGWGKGS
jgi:hypothetical protein